MASRNNSAMAKQAINPPHKRSIMGSKAFSAIWSHKWFVFAVVLALGVGAWQGVRLIWGPAVVVDQVRRGNLVETVVASGHVETPFRVEIGSQITGTVDDVLVQEGERVRKGQPLISLESRELKAAVVQAQGAVAQAEARMRQLDELTLPSAREALTQAQANLLNAQQTFDRTSQLTQNGYATRAALDEAQKVLDVARTQVRTAEFQVYTASPNGSDYVMAQTQLNQAHASLETTQSRLGYATISAPRDGVLIIRNVERGQKAVASADAYPDKRFDAVISYINPGVDISRASVEVKLTVADPPDYLRQDMTVSVDIEVAAKDRTLVVPIRSVHDVLSGQPWALGIKDSRAAKRPVRLGLRGNTQLEILEGMAEGEVAIPANSGVLTGQRVRAIVP
jgi:HlyD family secretion protein